MSAKIKTKTESKPGEESDVDTGIQIVKTASCPNLAGKAKLTYQFGRSPQGKLLVRIAGNSGSGSFADEWFALDGIWQEMDRNSPNDGPVTSGDMMKCYAGKSQNSAGFAFAALKAEGFVVASQQKRRCYDRIDATTYESKCKVLLAGKSAPVDKSKRTGSKPADSKTSKRTAKGAQRKKLS